MGGILLRIGCITCEFRRRRPTPRWLSILSDNAIVTIAIIVICLSHSAVYNMRFASTGAKGVAVISFWVGHYSPTCGPVSNRVCKRDWGMHPRILTCTRSNSMGLGGFFFYWGDYWAFLTCLLRCIGRWWGQEDALIKAFSYYKWG